MATPGSVEVSPAQGVGAGRRDGGRFGKAARLLVSADFRRVTAKGAKTVSPHFLLFARNDDGTKEPRLGLTVSRKVGNAVIRNRIKRIVREYFRLHRDGLKPTLECVVIARPRARHSTGAELRTSLDKLFGPHFT